MITLVFALLCARFILAGLGFVFGLVLAVGELVIELVCATGRWVVWPVSVACWRILNLVMRRLTAARTPMAPAAVRPWRAPTSSPYRVPRALARQNAVIAGVRSARA